MNTNKRQLLEMICQGEGTATEFKACRSRLSRDIYETVCAFLNRHGGTILLGISNSGNIQGIEQDAVAQIKKDGELTGEVAGEVTGEVYKLLRVIDKCSLTRIEAQAALELKGQANFRDRHMGPALEAGLIEMTIPGKPRSSKQKYRLTARGMEVVQGSKSKSSRSGGESGED